MYHLSCSMIGYFNVSSLMYSCSGSIEGWLACVHLFELFSADRRTAVLCCQVKRQSTLITLMESVYPVQDLGSNISHEIILRLKYSFELTLILIFKTKQNKTPYENRIKAELIITNKSLKNMCRVVLVQIKPEATVFIHTALCTHILKNSFDIHFLLDHQQQSETGGWCKNQKFCFCKGFGLHH